MQQHWLNQQQETYLKTVNIFLILFNGARGAEFYFHWKCMNTFNVFQLNTEVQTFISELWGTFSMQKAHCPMSIAAFC